MGCSLLFDFILPPHTTEHMQVFVKDSGCYQVDQNDTISSIHERIYSQFNYPLAEQRLLYGGRQLQPDSTFLEAGITNDSTLHLAFSLYGGVKKKCTFPNCSLVRAPIVGDCSFCEGKFCAKHRLLEDHQCIGLGDCKKESHDRNKATLEAQQCVANRV